MIFAAGSGAIFALSAFTLHFFTVRTVQPLTTASVEGALAPREGMLLVPDGTGSCHKHIYANDTGRATYAGIVACDATRPVDVRANLPPALRGMQDSLRNR